jgi:hypothetical protein
VRQRVRDPDAEADQEHHGGDRAEARREQRDERDPRQQLGDRQQCGDRAGEWLGHAEVLGSLARSGRIGEFRDPGDDQHAGQGQPADEQSRPHSQGDRIAY